MLQVDKKPLPKLVAGVGFASLTALALNLLFSPDEAKQLDAAMLQTLAKGDTFKTVQGEGSRAVHVFISTDCSYCRQVEPELAKLQNVTIYRHLLPGHSREGKESAVKVWCADAPISSWRAVAAGREIDAHHTKEDCDLGALERNKETAQRLGLKATPAMIFGDGQVSVGMQSAGELGALLDRSSTQ